MTKLKLIILILFGSLANAFADGPNYAKKNDTLQYFLWESGIKSTQYASTFTSGKYVLRKAGIGLFGMNNLSQTRSDEKEPFKLSSYNIIEDYKMNDSLKVKMMPTLFAHPVFVQNEVDIADALNSSKPIEYGFRRLDEMITDTVILINKGHSRLNISDGMFFNLDSKTFTPNKTISPVLLTKKQWAKEFDRRLTTKESRNLDVIDSLFHPANNFDESGKTYDTNTYVSVRLNSGDYVPLYFDIMPRYVGAMGDTILIDIDDGLNRRRAGVTLSLTGEWEIDYFIGDGEISEKEIYTGENPIDQYKFDDIGEENFNREGYDRNNIILGVEINRPGYGENSSHKGRGIAPVFISNNKGYRTRISSIDLVGRFNPDVMFIDSIVPAEVWSSDKYSGWKIDLDWQDAKFSEVFKDSTHYYDDIDSDYNKSVSQFRIKAYSEINKNKIKLLEDNQIDKEKWLDSLLKGFINIENEHIILSYFENASFNVGEDNDNAIMDITEPIAFIHYTTLLGNADSTLITMDTLYSTEESATVSMQDMDGIIRTSAHNKYLEYSLFDSLSKSKLPMMSSKGILKIKGLIFSDKRTRKVEESPEITNVFPNPTNMDKELTVKYSLYKDSKISFSLVSTSGEVFELGYDVDEKKGIDKEKTFIIDDSYPKGAYYLIIRSGKDLASKLLIII